MSRVIRKWNFWKHEYESVTIPNDWVIAQIRPSLDDRINCASCGTKIKYGDAYDSRVLHDDLGLAYSVCKECLIREIKVERNCRKQQREKLREEVQT